MAGLLREAVAAGASGFTTSTSPTHNDSFGRAVPSRFAEPEEFFALADAVKASPRPMVGISPGTKFSGISPEERALMIGMGQRSGGMVHWNPLMTSAAMPDLHTKFLELSDEARAAGVRVVGVYNPGPAGPSRVDLKSGFLFDSLPRWKEVLKLPIPERCAALASEDVRVELRDDLAKSNNGKLSEVLRTIWTTLTVTSAPSEANRRYVGRQVADIAAEEGRDPMDVMFDISVADELETVFMSDRPEATDPWAIETLLELCHNQDVVFGGSDAGAHLDFMSNEPTPSRAIALRVRDQRLLSLEETVHGFTGALADAFGITDRGTLAVGQAADVCVFDLERIGAESPELVRDLPGDSERLVAAPTGIRCTIVNGVVVNEDDTATGALSGRLL
jgi:N-acyl-D-aspartate/D-glutamate deacylase